MRTQRLTTAQRGYGAAHVNDRARLLAALQDGTTCPFRWCGHPMFHPKRCPYGKCWRCTLDRDHPIPLLYGGGDSPGRLTHARCNRKAGQLIAAKRRAAKNRTAKPRRRLPVW